MKRQDATRQSRFARATRPEGLLLQTRDRAIVTAVHACRHLTRSQLQRLLRIPTVSRINARLRKLYDHRFLDRTFVPVSLASSEALYTIGVHGVPLVAEALGCASDTIAALRRKGGHLTPHTLLHDVQVNDVRIALTLDVRRLPSCGHFSWRHPDDCAHAFTVPSGGGVRQAAVKPDGFCQLVCDGKQYSFCFELDRSTSSHRKLSQKFDAYVAFLSAGLQAPAYGVSALHVLVVTKSVQRRAELHRLVEGPLARHFFFAAFADVQAEPLTAAVWYRGGETHPRSLFALAAIGGTA